MDHRLRSSSKDEADFVRSLAKKYKVKFYKKTLNPKKKVSLEAWGREERYKFFNDLIKKYDFSFVLTAHHADDLAETFLIKIIQNKELSLISPAHKEFKAIRPLLGVTKKELEEYLKKEKLEFVQDESNFENKFLRNKIRNRLIPYLSKNFNNSILKILSNRAAVLSEDNDFLYLLAEKESIKYFGLKFGSKEWYQKLRLYLNKQQNALSWRLVDILFSKELGLKLGRRDSLRVQRFILESNLAIQISNKITIKRFNSGLLIEHN